MQFDKGNLIAGDMLVISYDDAAPEVGVFVGEHSYNIEDPDLIQSMLVLTLHGVTYVEVEQVTRHKSGKNIFVAEP